MLNYAIVHAMKTLGLLSRKGGVGKATLAIHPAALAQRAGRRTLLIDIARDQMADIMQIIINRIAAFEVSAEARFDQIAAQIATGKAGPL